MTSRLEEKENRRMARIEAMRETAGGRRQPPTNNNSFMDDPFDDNHLGLDFERHFSQIVGVTKFALAAGLVLTALIIVILVAVLIALV